MPDLRVGESGTHQQRKSLVHSDVCSAVRSICCVCIDAFRASASLDAPLDRQLGANPPFAEFSVVA